MNKRPLNADQEKALKNIQHFIKKGRERAFILKGAAGTGKTTLLSHLRSWLIDEKISNAYLSTTGRAAQVLKEKTGAKTSTIHAHLYVLDEVNSPVPTTEDPWVDEKGQLVLKFGLKTTQGEEPPPKVIVVDEASMISIEQIHHSQAAYFGSGNILEDLIQASQDSKFIFVGDAYQLPPITNSKDLTSIALSETHLMNLFGLRSIAYELTQIMRQDSDSSILDIAHSLRQQIDDIQSNKPIYFPKVYSDHIKVFNKEYELFGHYKQTYKKYGSNQVKFIAHSNGEVHGANRYIRILMTPKDLLGRIGIGEPLLVTQNCRPLEWFNGDIIQAIVPAKYDKGHTESLDFYKCKFKRLYDGDVQNYRLIHSHLFSKEANLDLQDFRVLLIDFDMRMRKRGIKRNSTEYLDQMKNDPYLNALRCKFGYAVSCHKAQGGEWEHVFLKFDPQYLFRRPKDYVLRWLYTAVTRSSKNLYLLGGQYIKEVN